jgi:hypothetical protein
MDDKIPRNTAEAGIFSVNAMLMVNEGAIEIPQHILASKTLSHQSG